MPANEIDIIGCKLTLGDKTALFDQIEDWLQTNGQHIVVYGNPHTFNLAYESRWLQTFINSADWVGLDGIGLIIGARILGCRTSKRFTYADALWDLTARCERKQYRMFLLGAKEPVVEQAAQRLQEEHPHLCLVGTHHGYFDKTPGSSENQQVLSKIQQAAPDILLVGFGVPLQERWIEQNRDQLGEGVIITCGAALDYIAGTLPRAPRWMRQNGLEWLGRLLIEPRRLWRRYLVGNPKFLWRVLKQRLRGSRC